MGNVEKKLSIAFYWHMHQPIYQLNPDSDYLMPWVRLHAVKDYLDMLLVLDKFKKTKLNFNFVPALLDAFIDYSEHNAHDIHSRLSVSNISELTNDDKEYILNNFFDAEYATMISPFPYYNELYQKRFNINNEKPNIESFSNQEYSDIMAWFNLAWIDASHYKKFPEIEKLIKKGKNYTLEDRINIIEIHREIIKMIIPSYKKFLKSGRIEITTTPYYHPIMPIMMNVKASQKNLATVDSTLSNLDLHEEAQLQTQMAIDKIEEIFGKKPTGMWPAEQAVSPETLDIFAKNGIKWTISDEGVLAKSIDFNFVRDFKGYLADPYFLMKTYKYKTSDDNRIDMIFRDSVIPNLISFEYANHEPKAAANDLYDRIKVIQDKLITSPDKTHLLTIALDGENCWENYKNDGADFLKEMYSIIEKDKTLETVLISDYVLNNPHPKQLEKLYSGSWINQNFQFWIGEPVKNVAWSYLKKVKIDFDKFVKKNPDNPEIKSAHRELMIAQGSDWFWWYGEPNNSGQDYIFDYLFREHLKNTYRYLGSTPPKYLDLPLISMFSQATQTPQESITPKINGIISEDDNDEWLNAGCVNVPDGPILQEDKLFDKICYGADNQNFYLRLYLSPKTSGNFATNPILNQMYIYMRNSDRKQVQSPIRLINKTENISPIMLEKFHNELRISMMDNKLYPIRFTKAIQSDLWAMQDKNDVQIAYKNVIDISIPFENLDIDKGEKLEFFFANANFGIKDAFSQQDIMLTIIRP